MESLLIKDVPVVVFDTETTGLSPLSHVVELGATKLRGTRMVDTFVSLVKPPVSIPQKVVRIHGIDDSMVRDAPPFKTVARKFMEFVKGSILVAHNSSFDLRVLSINFQRRGLPLLDNPVLDTRKISRRHFPEVADHSLPHLIHVWRSPFKGCHRALADARHTAYIFMGMMQKLGLGPHDRVADLFSLFGPPDSMLRYQAHWEEVGKRDSRVERLLLAVREGRDLEIFYDGGDAQGRRCISPLALFSTGKIHYLKAMCSPEGRVKTFRIDRITYIRPIQDGALGG